jgi:hypothetical protein
MILCSVQSKFEGQKLKTIGKRKRIKEVKLSIVLFL